MKRILFVCTGNICRSPTAEGLARQLARKTGMDQRFEFDSAGTHAYHTGEPPDPRAIRAARKRGYDLSGLRARPVVPEDFERFDLILAMDRGHFTWLKRECPKALQSRIELFMAYSSNPADQDVPDPYYGSDDGFEHVLDLCEEAVSELLRRHAE